MSLIRENQIKDQIEISKTKARQMEYWDGEPENDYHNGYVHALEWVLGKVNAKYDKEDI